MGIPERLKSFMEEKGVTNREIDQRCHFSNGLTGKFLNGKTVLGIDKIEVILQEFPELSAEWLIKGQGPRYVSVYKNSGTEEHVADALSEQSNVYFAESQPVQGEGVPEAELSPSRMRWVEQQLEELRRRLMDKEETINALKETVRAYQKLANI